MDGVDGWAFNPITGDAPLSRDGTGYAVPPASPDSGSLVHAITPLDVSGAFSASFDVIYPTFPFAFLVVGLGLLDAGGAELITLAILGGSDGTPPFLRVTVNGSPSDSGPLTSPSPTPTRITFVYDGAVSWTVYQDGVQVLQNFPITIGAAMVTQVELLLDDTTDAPPAAIHRVSVPGLM